MCWGMIKTNMFSSSFSTEWDTGRVNNVYIMVNIVNERVTSILMSFAYMRQHTNIIIGSDNGLSAGRRQAFNRNLYISIIENPFENVVWKITAILFRPQYFDSRDTLSANNG